MFENFTGAARRSVEHAEREATDGEKITQAHLLLGLLMAHGAVSSALHSCGVTEKSVRAASRHEASAHEKPNRVGTGRFSSAAGRAMSYALRASLTHGRSEIETVHIALGIVEEHSRTADATLTLLDIDAAALRMVLDEQALASASG